MTKRRNLDRERLEVYLLHLLLAYRPILQITGYLLLFIAIAALFSFPIFSGVSLEVAIFMIFLTTSYQATLLFAKIWGLAGNNEKELRTYPR